MKLSALIFVAQILLGSCVQAPPNVGEISARNSAALDRHNKEVIACKPFNMDQATKELQDSISHPNILWNGSDFVDIRHEQAEKRWDALLNEWEKCDIEAAARLKTQLWSP